MCPEDQSMSINNIVLKYFYFPEKNEVNILISLKTAFYECVMTTQNVFSIINNNDQGKIACERFKVAYK